MRERLSLYFLLAVLLPLVFGTLVSERLIERHIVGLARSSAEERLDSVAGRLEDRARFVQMGLSQLAASRGLLDAAAAADPTLVSASLRGALMPRQLDVLALVAPDGHLVSRTGGKRDHITLDLKQDVSLRRAFAGETVISYEILDGMLVQAVTVPVRERDRTLGALLGATILTGNDTLCAHLVDRGQGEAALAQGSSWVASSWIDDSRGPSFVGSALRAEQLGALQRRQRWAGPSPDPSEGYMAVGSLSDASGQVVGGVAGLVSTAGLSALQVDARRSFFAAMGLGALVSLLLALVAARRMTAPLRRLAQKATDMQKGKLDAPIEVEGDDEVAQLARALNETARALAESMATLESRVQERVHELTEAHDREAALNRELIAHNEQLRLAGRDAARSGRGAGAATHRAGREDPAQRGGGPAEERLHRQHEPRDPHAAQLGARAVAAAARRHGGRAVERSAPLPGGHRAQRAESPAPHQRHPRPVSHRGGASGDGSPDHRHRRADPRHRRARWCRSPRPRVWTCTRACPTTCRACVATSIACARS